MYVRSYHCFFHSLNYDKFSLPKINLKPLSEIAKTLRNRSTEKMNLLDKHVPQEPST